MPMPYAEPGGSYNLLALAALGSPGAVAATKQNYINTANENNSAPVVLSGVLAIIAAFPPLVYDGVAKVTITGSVAAADTAGSPAGGSLLVDIQDSGTSIIGGPITQDYVANGAVVSFTLSFVPSAGSHTWQLKARHGDTGDGATVGTSHGQLTVTSTVT